MSPDTNRTLTMDGQITIDPQSPAYYFDYAPVLERCEPLRSHPERLALLCKNHVRMLAPGDLMLPCNDGFFLVVQTRTGAAADAVAREIELALLELLFGTDSLYGLTSIFFGP